VPFAELHELQAGYGTATTGSNGRAGKTAEAEKKREGVVGGVAGAVKGVSNKARALRASAGAAVGDFTLVVVGLLTLASAILGSLVLYRLSRQHLLR
jgi:hypothetical protein